MAVTLNLLERADFVGQVDRTALKAPKMFVEQLFFPTTEDHLANAIVWEKVEGSDRMAVYVNPDEQSKLVEGRGSEIDTLSIPMTNEHAFFQSYDLAIGKGFGSGSPFGSTEADIRTYRNKKIQDAITDLIDRVRRRRAWAASQAVSTGKIEFKGDNLHFVIDFGIPGSQKKKNTGDDRWSEAASDPLAQGRAHRRTVSKGSGAQASFCVMGPDAAERFITNAKVRETLHNNNLKAGAIDLTKAITDGVVYLGNVEGIEYYEFSDTYTDSKNVVREMWDPNLAVYASKTRHRRRHRGIVAWEEEGLQRAKEFYSRQLVKKDPDGRKVQLASSEIPVIHDPYSLLLVETN